MVISHSLWQRKFGGDRSILGRHVRINGTDVAVIGITPPDFQGVPAALAFDVWMPVTLQPLMNPGYNRLELRGDAWLQSFARLKDGVTLRQAMGEMAALATRISQFHGDTPVRSAAVVRLQEQFAGELFPLFTALLVVAGIVDYTLPDVNGEDIIDEVHAARPGIPVAIWSGQEDDELPERVIERGAIGFLSKAVAITTIPPALDLMLAGETFVSTRGRHALYHGPAHDHHHRASSAGPAQRPSPGG